MFATTGAVWDHARPRLAGRWFRVEVVTPDGFPDVVGFYKGQTIFVEIKANGDRLRPAQRIWLGDAIAAGVPAYILKAMGARLAWFQDLDCKREVAPAFWRRG